MEIVRALFINRKTVMAFALEPRCIKELGTSISARKHVQGLTTIIIVNNRAQLRAARILRDKSTVT
jgi:hypothetical protein